MAEVLSMERILCYLARYPDIRRCFQYLRRFDALFDVDWSHLNRKQRRVEIRHIERTIRKNDVEGIRQWILQKTLPVISQMIFEIGGCTCIDPRIRHSPIDDNRNSDESTDEEELPTSEQSCAKDGEEADTKNVPEAENVGESSVDIDHAEPIRN